MVLINSFSKGAKVVLTFRLQFLANSTSLKLNFCIISLNALVYFGIRVVGL
jgi:hypothetical protein